MFVIFVVSHVHKGRQQLGFGYGAVWTQPWAKMGRNQATISLTYHT